MFFIVVVVPLRDTTNEGSLSSSLLWSTAKNLLTAYTSSLRRTDAPHCTDWLHRQCIVGAGDFIPYEDSRYKADYVSSMIACPPRWIPWYWLEITTVKDGAARTEWVCILPHRSREGAQQQSGGWSSRCLWIITQTLCVCVCVRACVRACVHKKIIAFLVIPAIGHLSGSSHIHPWPEQTHV